MTRPRELVQATSDNVVRYRIEVMALAADDVVANLGGVLFDRRCLGWDTMVVLNDRNDIRPLQIIGADCTDLQSTLDIPPGATAGGHCHLDTALPQRSPYLRASRRRHR